MSKYQGVSYIWLIPLESIKWAGTHVLVELFTCMHQLFHWGLPWHIGGSKWEVQSKMD